MTTILKPKQGLSAPVVLNIPKQWNSEWFRRFITNYLQNADVRNTVGATGGSFNNPPTQQTVASAVAVFTRTAAGSVPAPGGSGTIRFIREDGTWAVPTAGTGTVTSVASGVGVVATPNPITTTGSLAVDQSFAPTWTHAHIFAPSAAGTAIDIVSSNGGGTGIDLEIARNGTTANTFQGGPNLLLLDSSAATQNAVLQYSGGQVELWLTNAGNPAGAQIIRVLSSLAIQGRGPTNGMTDMTPDSGSFTGTLTGGTTSPTMTIEWSRQGNDVTMVFGGQAVTSNSTSFTITGLPAALQPVSFSPQLSPCTAAFDNSVQFFTCQAQISAGSGTISLSKNGSTTGWTAAGTKALNSFNFSYSIR